LEGRKVNDSDRRAQLERDGTAGREGGVLVFHAVCMGVGASSLDVHVQAKSPGPDKEANWLPCPPSGPFNLTIRVYQPKKEILDGAYKLPAVKKV